MKRYLSKKGVLYIILTAVTVCIAAFTANAVLSNSTESYSFRSQTEKGNIAVVHYANSMGMLLCTGSGERSELISDEGVAYTYAPADEYTFRGKGALYLSGTYDNSAVAFYVKEADAEEKRLFITANAVDEAEFFAGIKADGDASSTVSIAVTDGTSIYWRELVTSSEDSASTEIYYEDCPFDEAVGAYLVVLRVDYGMTRFDDLRLEGLTLAELEACRYTLYYSNGVLRHGDPDGENFAADESVHFNTVLLREIVESEIRADDTDKDLTGFFELFDRLLDFILSVLDFFSIFEG